MENMEAFMAEAQRRVDEFHKNKTNPDTFLDSIADRTQHPAQPWLDQLYKIDMGDDDHDDGREEALEAFIFSRADELRNNPAAIVAAMDQFGKEKDFLMTLGPAKCQIITQRMREVKPRIMVELGTYVGYSAIALGAALQDIHSEAPIGSVRFYTMELNEKFAKLTERFVELAGLSSIVEVVIGTAEDSLRKLHGEGKLPQIDVLILDHWEKFYVPDTKVCEELGVLKKGSILIADNVVAPGAPEYLEYIRAKKEWKSEEIKSIMPMGIPVRA